MHTRFDPEAEMRRTVTLLICCLLFAGCASRKAPSYLAERRGVKQGQEYPMIALDKFRSESGQISGSFFFGGGTISGNSQGASVIEFAIKLPKTPVQPEQLAIVDIPVSKIAWLIVDDAAIPTAEFTFVGKQLYYGEDSRKKADKPYDDTAVSELLSEYTRRVDIRLNQVVFDQQVSPQITRSS